MKKILLSCVMAANLVMFGACLATSLQPANGYSSQLAEPKVSSLDN